MNPSGRCLVGWSLVASFLMAPGVASSEEPPRPAARRKAAPVQQVKGTRVSLAPPEGFIEGRSFSGFRQEETGASIMVTELPLAFETVSKGLTAEALSSQGMESLSRKPAKVGGHTGFLVQVRQASGDKVFLKWILVLGNDSDTLLLTAAWREQDKALSRPLEQALRSARWTPDAAPGPGLELFTLKQTPGLKEAQRIQGVVMYTRDGQPPGRPPAMAPHLLVAPSMTPTRVDEDVEAFSRVRLEGVAESLTLESSALLTVDGLKGHEVVARAKDANPPRDFTLYHLLLLDEGRYFLIQGRVGDEDRATYLEHFKTAARSFQRVPLP
ncbi:hypothetical protein ACLESD_17125 [Pyxidicoccus sp. 3LFB2]